MIDFLIGLSLGAGGLYLILRVAPTGRQGSPTIPTTLEGFGQVLAHESQAVIARFDAFEAKYQPIIERDLTMLSNAFNQAVQRLVQAAEAKGAASSQAEVQAAAAAKEADATAAVDAAAGQLVQPSA